DGQYVYFGDYAAGVVARYDTMQAITTSNAWVFFQTTQINAGYHGYMGLVYTGRYLVFVPEYNGAYFGVALAYDTKGKFGELTSWTPYGLAGTDGGMGVVGSIGGQFDGRYVSLAPYSTGIVMRWDPTLPFSLSSSWEALNLPAIHAGASGFFGTAF